MDGPAGAAPSRRRYSTQELDEIAHRLENWTLRPAGTEGYATAEVTVGGIDTRELSSKTMEARASAGTSFYRRGGRCHGLARRI